MLVTQGLECQTKPSERTIVYGLQDSTCGGLKERLPVTRIADFAPNPKPVGSKKTTIGA